MELHVVQIHSLLYPDDISIIAESGEDLQVMLTSLSEWCLNWNLNINTSKTQVIHFHSKSVPRSTFKFYISNKELEIVSQYRYLGLVLEESLDMSYTAKIVAQSATRSLGVLINKFKAQSGMPYETYTKLFYSLVQPVLEYAAPVWAYRDHSCISAIQHKAGRFSLGVGRYTPSSAVLGDLVWLPVKLNLWINLIREWCRLHAVDSSRLNYKIFRYALEHMNKTKFCHNVGLEELLVHEVPLWRSVSYNVNHKVCEYFSQKWYDNISSPVGSAGIGHNKLRTYATFKSSLLTETYIVFRVVSNRKHRSAMAKFRMGVAPIRLETGRYEGLSVEDRLCPLC